MINYSQKTKRIHKNRIWKWKSTQTCERNRAIDGEDTCQASRVKKSAVGVAREDFPAITAEEFDGRCVFVVVGLHESFWKFEREREFSRSSHLVWRKVEQNENGFSKRGSKDFIWKLVFWILSLRERERLYFEGWNIWISFIKGCVKILLKNIKIWRQQLCIF